MATYIDDLTAIRNRFTSQWKAANPSTPYVFDLTTKTPATDEIFVRFSVRPGNERRRSMFQRVYDQLGRVYLQVVVPRTLPDGNGWALASSFSDIFRDWHSDDHRIVFDVPSTQVQDVNGEPYVITVSVPYTARH